VNKVQINRDVVERISANTGFQDIVIEQVFWLSWILQELCVTEIGRDFALMGGSAIVFMHEDIYRLSVDIDLDYVANPDLGRNSFEEIKELQNLHRGLVEQISKKFAIRFKVLKQTNRFMSLQLLYRSVFGPERSIDLDMGYRYCHSVLKPDQMKWPNMFMEKDWPDFRLQVLAPEELWASKIIATIGGGRIDTEEGAYLGFKRKIRHLYDTYYLVNLIIRKKSKIDLKLLKSIVLLFGASRIEKFEFFRGDLIGLYSFRDLDTELFPVLKSRENYPSLLEMQRKVRRFLDDVIFNFVESDYQFFEDFSNETFRPERLFKDVRINKRLKSMFFYDEMMKKILTR
jgi:predicted nucleotidyltransferase component of viral defense system